MRQKSIPLYVIGMPDDEFQSKLITSKFRKVLTNLEKTYSKIVEARLNIKAIKRGGASKKQSYQVTALIITRQRTHTYKQLGWDLTNVCEELGQRLQRNLSKRRTDRSKPTIRKIRGKIF
jgi:hypothetical protein